MKNHRFFADSICVGKRASMFSMVGTVFLSLGLWTTPAQGELFTAIYPGLGDSYQFDAAHFSYFSTIVDSFVGDLDGDGKDDILLLASVVPQNGAYAGTPINGGNMDCYGQNQNPGTFLNPTDYLYGFNDPRMPINMFPLGEPWINIGLGAPNPQKNGHWSDPSSNIVAGWKGDPAGRTYNGSDLAWLQGNGRGHFVLRFITIGGQPVTIKMGNRVRMGDMDNDGRMDIVLSSQCDLKIDNYGGHGPRDFPDYTTTVEPFTGTGRVMWLKNLGPDGTGGLNFSEHLVSQYNYDRAPVVFFSARNCDSSMNPSVEETVDVDGDGNRDIFLINHGGGSGWANDPANLMTPAEDAALQVRAGEFNPKIRLPRAGERYWGTYAAPRPNLLWYQNVPANGNARFSTATLQEVLIDGSRASRDPRFFKRVRLNSGDVYVGGGYYWIPYQTLPYLSVYRREAPATPMSLRTMYTDNTVVEGIAGVGDLNGDGNEELVFNLSNSKTIRVLGFTRNGDNVALTNVDIDLEIDLSAIRIVDVNGDGRNDILLVNRSPVFNPSLILLINRSQPGTNVDNLQFLPFNVEESRYFPDTFPGLSLLPWNNLDRGITVSTGNFNGDGLVDFVRTGPGLPLTLFLNNLGGTRRAIATITVQHRSGTTKSWRTVLGGMLNNIFQMVIPANSAGSINVQTSESK